MYQSQELYQLEGYMSDENSDQLREGRNRYIMSTKNLIFTYFFAQIKSQKVCK